MLAPESTDSHEAPETTRVFEGQQRSKTMNIVRSSILVIAVAWLSAGLSPQALGEEGQRDRAWGDNLRRTVSASDLDLSRLEDVQILYRRIQSTARSLCSRAYVSAPWDVKRVLHRKRCYEEAVGNAVSGTGHAELAAVHRGEIDRVASLR